VQLMFYSKATIQVHQFNFYIRKSNWVLSCESFQTTVLRLKVSKQYFTKIDRWRYFIRLGQISSTKFLIVTWTSRRCKSYLPLKEKSSSTTYSYAQFSFLFKSVSQFFMLSHLFKKYSLFLFITYKDRYLYVFYALF